MRQRLLMGFTAAMVGLSLTPTIPTVAAHAAPPVTAKLAIELRPKPILGHEVATIVGYLTPVRVGRAVKLQRAVGASWVTLGTARTNAKGDYSLRTRAPLSGQEVVRALLIAADGGQVVSPSLTIAPVKASVGLAGVSWVRTGGVVHTTGAFAPARPGRVVALQRLAGTRWVTVATAHLSGSSHYVMNAKVTVPPGAESLRVLALPQNGSVAAASAVHVLTVTDVPPALVGPISTVYLGLKKGSNPGSYGTAPGTPALSFTQDGRVTSAVPVDGPDAATVPLAPSVRTGVYGAHDGVVDLAWDIDGTTVTLRPNSLGQLTWNGLVYGVVDPMQTTRLSGTYKRLTGGSGATITFKGTGRFSDDGITGDTNLPGTDNPSGVGSYEIRNNTIYLVYDAGPLETMAIYALPQFLGDKAQIVLAGTTFRRL
jgi:hypothetical protein